jgi:tryptophan-rich sensory protein
MLKSNEEWYTTLNKSSLTPSNQIFPIVWTLLYIMIALSGYKYISENSEDEYGIIIFSIQIFLNVIWTYLFFTLREPELALADIGLLWITIVLTINRFYMKSRLAAYLLIPYLGWVSFAGYLNYYIVVNN